MEESLTPPVLSQKEFLENKSELCPYCKSDATYTRDEEMFDKDKNVLRIDFCGSCHRVWIVKYTIAEFQEINSETMQPFIDQNYDEDIFEYDEELRDELDQEYAGEFDYHE